MGALRYNIALAVSNILFGASFSIYVSLLRGTMQAEQIFVLQLLFSTFIFAPLALTRRDFAQLSLNEFGSIFIVALLVIFGWRYMLIKGASYTNPIDASTLSTIGPIFTLITALIVEGRRASRGEIVGMIIALSGVAFILVDRGRLLLQNNGEGYGNALILCAVIAIAINTVLIAPVLRRHGTLVVMGWYYIIGTLLAMPMIITEMPTLVELNLSATQLLELLYILLLGTTLPMYLLYISAEHLSALHAAIYRYLQPAVATTLALIRGQSAIDRTNIVGAVLIFLGMSIVIFATYKGKRILATHE